MRRFSFLLSAPFALIVLASVVFAPIQPASAQDPTVCAAYGFPYFCDMIITPTPFQSGSVNWADLNADGSQDLVISGNVFKTVAQEPDLQFWFNLGEFIVITPAPDETKPPGIGYETRYRESTASASFGVINEVFDGATLTTDLTGDGKIDVVATGVDRSGNVKTLVFENTFGQSVEFTKMAETIGIVTGAITSGDFDNDGDTDVVIAGKNSDDVAVLIQLKNEPDTDEKMIPQPIGQSGFAIGSLDVGDFDSDKDSDLLVTGVTPSGDSVTRIYRNDNGTLTDSGIDLPGFLFARARFVDLDQDGDLDIALTGAQLSPFVLEGRGIVLSNSVGTFAQTATFEGRYFGGLATGDVDGDGVTDLLVSGGTRLGFQNFAALLSNSGNGSSFPVHSTFGGGLFGQVVAGDYDGDADLDILMFGKLDGGANRFLPYRNEGSTPNTAPSPPDNLISVVGGSVVNLAWGQGSDLETTATPTLSYNLRVGTAPGLNDVVASNAAPDGRRLISARGNVDHNNAWYLKDLSPGTYFWSVQTIDSALTASPFSAEESFVIQ